MWDGVQFYLGGRKYHIPVPLHFVLIFLTVTVDSNILLNILLIPKYGVIGSAWATVFAFMFMSLSVFIRCHKIYPVTYNWSAWIYPLIIMGVVFIISDDIWARLALTLFYPIPWFLFVINSEEKTVLKSFIK